MYGLCLNTYIHAYIHTYIHTIHTYIHTQMHIYIYILHISIHAYIIIYLSYICFWLVSHQLIDNYKYVINVVSLWCMWYTDFSIALAKHDNCQTAGCLKKELRAAEPDFVSLVMRVAISNTFQPEIFQHLLLRITLHLRFCNIFMTWSSCDQLLSEHWPRLAHGELGRRVGDPGGLLKTSEVHWSLASIDSCRLSS
jgi:hypothetical protein